MPKPKVLISDALSPAAVQIFRDRGVEVDYVDPPDAASPSRSDES